MSRARSGRGPQSRPGRNKESAEQSAHLASAADSVAATRRRRGASVDWVHACMHACTHCARAPRPRHKAQPRTIKTYAASGHSPAIRKSSRTSQNCPWMSPTTVTGLETGWMLLSSRSWPLTMLHSSFICDSVRGLHCLICPSQASRSLVDESIARKAGEAPGWSEQGRERAARTPPDRAAMQQTK